MGLSLFNRRICNTYTGVIKTCDNTNITVTPKPMTDGVGNDIPINIGTSTICYSGTQDFSGATVIGISGATAGLVSGVGTGSMVSDGSLGLLSTADGSCSISLGYGAYNDQERSISIGQGSTGLCACTITIGFAANGNGNNALALGNNATVSTNCGIAIGEAAQSGGVYAIGIGRSSNARCANSISIGNISDILSEAGTAVGAGTCIGPSAISSTALGHFATSCGRSAISIGCGNITSGNCGITIGAGIINPHDCSIAMGSCQNLTLNTTSSTDGLISIGECVTVQSNFGVSIGRCSCVLTNPNIFDGGIAIGAQACAFNLSAIAIGFDAHSHCGSVAIGVSSEALAANSVAIAGYATGSSSVNIAGTNGLYGSCADQSIAIGINTSTIGGAIRSIAIGTQTEVCTVGTNAIAMGYTTVANAFGSTALGSASCSNAACSVALGYNVTANRANVVTSCEFESCVAGCGLIVKTPDGLNSYRIAVDNSGNITTALA